MFFSPMSSVPAVPIRWSRVIPLPCPLTSPFPSPPSLPPQMELASDLATGLQLGSGITPLLLRLDAHLLGVASAAAATAAAPPAPAAEAEEGAEEGVVAPEAGSEPAEAAHKVAKARTLVSELLAEGLVLLELQVAKGVGRAAGLPRQHSTLIHTLTTHRGLPTGDSRRCGRLWICCSQVWTH